jgi:hypothetical protein
MQQELAARRISAHHVTGARQQPSESSAKPVVIVNNVNNR